MNSLESVSTQRLYRLIADQIAAKITAGEFAPGTRLPSERELADKLQVSRSSIREALIALEIGGYVEIRVGSGVFVARAKEDGSYAGDRPATDTGAATDGASSLGAFELLETRMLFEPECAALAARTASDAQIASMRAHCLAMSRNNTPSQHDRAFHAAIAGACGNAALEAVVAYVWDLSEASVVFSRLDEHMVTSDVWQLALAEHRRVLEAIEEHDPVRARHEMHGHLLGVLSRLRKDFTSTDSTDSAPTRPPVTWEAPAATHESKEPSATAINRRSLRAPAPR